MTEEKPPTIRQQIDTLTGAVEALSLNLAAKPEKATSREWMTEAKALGVCLGALEQLSKDDAEKNRNSYGNHIGSLTLQGPTERILRHLAARFGVPLVERINTADPCSRLHLVDADPHEIVQALRGAL